MKHLSESIQLNEAKLGGRSGIEIDYWRDLLNELKSSSYEDLKDKFEFDEFNITPEIVDFVKGHGKIFWPNKSDLCNDLESNKVNMEDLAKAMGYKDYGHLKKSQNTFDAEPMFDNFYDVRLKPDLLKIIAKAYFPQAKDGGSYITSEDTATALFLFDVKNKMTEDIIKATIGNPY